LKEEKTGILEAQADEAQTSAVIINFFLVNICVCGDQTKLSLFHFCTIIKN
jgi:hypothetical protein